MKSKIPTALIIDKGKFKEWQKNALTEVNDLIEIKVILNCKNTIFKRRIFKYFLYYLINFFTIQNNYTKTIRYNNKKAKWINFDSIYLNNWQFIPQEILNNELSDIKLVIKFGMGLLDINKTNIELPIISYHHGDPSKYRGRPPGFYELLHREKNIGTMVQKLSNELDGGKILAINYSKIYDYSYKKSIENIFSNSRYLLKKAIINFFEKNEIKNEIKGKYYTLPNNYIALKFLFILFIRKINRFIYGILIEKNWKIILYDSYNLDFESDKIFSTDEGFTIKNNNKYIFLADPFFSYNENYIYAEGINKLNGLGEIINIDLNNLEIKNTEFKNSGHYAYPQCIRDYHENWLLPEMSDHDDQKLFNLKNNKEIYIKIECNYRLIDATIYKYKDTYFLFCGHAKDSLDNLYLYTSDKISGPYVSHPLNPIVTNPMNARMAGNIIFKDGALYRFGQNNSYKYGEKITVNHIKKLSKQSYEEDIISEIYFKDVKGPHTINFSKSKIILDYYTEEISIFAGYRRIIPKLLKIIRKAKIRY